MGQGTLSVWGRSHSEFLRLCFAKGGKRGGDKESERERERQQYLREYLLLRILKP